MTAVDPALRATRTTCPYCGVGCGVLATADNSGGAAISGDPGHPANFGRLCSKGAALGETLGLEDRLLHPMIRCSKGTMERVVWSDALDHVAHRFAHIVARDGADAVAFYLSGQLLTEDYYVANKLMKGFIGSANVDTNSRLCMASSVAGHRRAFGADTVPGCYEDLDEADLLVLVGSNAAWCHPVLFQRMLANKLERGARIVVIDPRRTDTAGDADLFLGLKPGTDTALFSGLLVQLADTGALDHDYIERHTSGFEDTLARARSIARSIAATALATGLSEADVADFFQMFRNTPRVVTMYSQGVNQSAQGTDKVNAIINCHLATGRIGRPGMGPFSLTGQPNAMGGREVGGLANQLAAHMGFTPTEIDRVRRFWNAPRMAEREGLKAVQMFEAIERGEIKALWVMATNPAMSLPRAGAMRGNPRARIRYRRIRRFIADVKLRHRHVDVGIPDAAHHVSIRIDCSDRTHSFRTGWHFAFVDPVQQIAERHRHVDLFRKLAYRIAAWIRLETHTVAAVDMSHARKFINTELIARHIPISSQQRPREMIQSLRVAPLGRMAPRASRAMRRPATS